MPINLNITTTNKPISRNFGISFNNIDKTARVATTSILGDVVALNKPLLVWANGTIGNFYFVRNTLGNIGTSYNCKSPQGDNCDECVTGINYATWQDFLDTVQATGANVVYTVNIYDAILNINNLSNFYSLINTANNDVKAVGGKIVAVQLGIEIHTMVGVTKENYRNAVNATLPTIKGFLTDCETWAIDTYGNAIWDNYVTKAIGINSTRLYYEVQENQYPTLLQLVNYANSVSNAINRNTFSNFSILLQQTEIKTAHPLYKTVSNAIYDIVLYGNCAKFNINNSNLLKLIGQFNLQSLISNAGLQPTATYYGVKSIDKIFGLSDINIIDTSSTSNVYFIGGKNADNDYTIIAVNYGNTNQIIGNIKVDNNNQNISSIINFASSNGTENSYTLNTFNDTNLRPYSWSEITLKKKK